MTDPSGTLTDTRQMDGYVDDFTSWVNDKTQLIDDEQALDQSADNTTKMLQQLSQQWEHLLACTGGRLELQKCFYYCVNWLFDENGRVQVNKTTESEIRLTDTLENNRTEMEILKKAPQEPHRTLGVFISPTENEEMAVNELTKKCQKFATMIRAATGNLSKREMRVFMSSLYKPALAYSLTASALSETQCQKIQSSVVHNLAVSLGYNRNSPRTLLHAPHYLGGANIPDLYCEQGISQISYILRHIRGATRTGKVLLIVLKWVQIHCGTIKSIWEDTKMPVEKYLPLKWINSVRQFLRDTDLQLHITGINGVKEQRVNDQSIMETAMKNKFTSGELIDINNCRIYLHVEMLSDITAAEGNSLQATAIHNSPPTGHHQKFLQSQTRKIFPRQAPPGQKAWNNWLKLMKTLSIEGSKGRLERKLGNWYLGKNDNNRIWQHYLRPLDGMLLIHKTSQPSDLFTPIPVMISKRTSRVYKYSPSITAHQINTPDETHCWVPTDATIDEQNCSIKTPQFYQKIKDRNYPDTPETQNQWNKQFLRQIDTQSTEILSELIRTEPEVCLLASQLHPTKEVYRWMIYFPISKYCTYNQGITSGQPVTNQRCELFGILSALEIITHVISKLEEAETSVKLLLIQPTTLGIMKRIQNWNHIRTDTLFPDWDVFEYLHQTMMKSNIPMKCLNRKKPSKADQEATTDMELKAIQVFNTKTILPSPKLSLQERTQNLPTHRVTLKNTMEDYISGYEESELRRHLNERDYIEYLTSKTEFKNKQISDFAWTERTKVMIGLDGNTCQLVGKQMHGWLPTITRLASIGESPTPTCLRCGLENETTEHIFKCPTSASEWRTKSLLDLHQRIQKHSNTTFSTKIYHHFQQWTQENAPATNIHPDKNQNSESFSADDHAPNWTQGMCGLFPSNWIRNRSKLTSRELQTIIHWAITSSVAAWHERCRQIHNQETTQKDRTSTTESLITQQLHKTIHELVEKQHTLNHSDRQYFDFDIEEFLRRKTPKDLIQWIRHTKQFIKHAQVRAREQTQGGNILQFIQQKDKYPP